MKDFLYKKLFLKKYNTIALVNDTEYTKALNELTTCVYQEDKMPYDVLFVHTFSTKEIETYLTNFWRKQAINQDGVIYLVYPKLKQKYFKGIHRDTILPDLCVDELGYVPNTQYKFVRMVSLNDIFTIIGAKYVPMKHKIKE